MAFDWSSMVLIRSLPFLRANSSRLKDSEVWPSNEEPSIFLLPASSLKPPATRFLRNRRHGRSRRVKPAATEVTSTSVRFRNISQLVLFKSEPVSSRSDHARIRPSCSHRGLLSLDRRISLQSDNDTTRMESSDDERNYALPLTSLEESRDYPVLAYLLCDMLAFGYLCPRRRLAAVARTAAHRLFSGNGPTQRMAEGRPQTAVGAQGYRCRLLDSRRRWRSHLSPGE